MHLDRIRAVLECVFLADPLIREFAQLAGHDEGKAERDRDRRAKDEPSALNSDDHVRLALSRVVDQQVDDLFESVRMLEDRRDVLEDDARFREIRDVANQTGGEKFGHDAGKDTSLPNWAVPPNLPAINESRLVDLFLKLLHINAPALGEGEIVAWTKKYLADAGLEVSEDDAGSKIGGNGNNLIVWLRGDRPNLPKVFLSAHFDTVEPTEGIVVEERDGVFASTSDTILGADDHGGMAPAVEAVLTLKESGLPHGDVCLLLSVAEEIGLQGAAALNIEDLGLDFGFVLDTGPPVGSFVTRTATHDKLEFTIRGKPAHAGKDPENGINAIKVLADAVAPMRIGRLGPEMTANLGIVKGGTAVNVVCPSVTVRGEARSTSVADLDAQVDHMIQCFEAAARAHGATVQIVHDRHYRSYEIPQDSDVVRIGQAASRSLGLEPLLRTTLGGSDANVYNAKGLPCIVMATGMQAIHTHDEHISRSDLILTARLALATLLEASKARD